jgi:group I intron endonuclease
VTPSSQSLALIKWSKPGIIYVARNRVNGMLYVGQTVGSLGYRRLRHLNDSINGKNWVLQRAIKKYGSESFDWFVIQKCNDRTSLNEAEKFWIATLGTIAPNGYNMNAGGQGNRGWTQEVREKMSRIMKDKPHSSREHMKKMSDALRGKKRPQEVRDKIAAGHRGKPKPSGPNNALYGKVLSEEHKKKISEWTKAKALRGPDHPNFGKKWSDDTRRRISEAKARSRELRRNKNQPGLNFG